MIENYLYVAAPKYVQDLDEVVVVIARNEEEVKDRLADIVSEDDFRDFVHTYACNAGLSSYFYCDENGYLWDEEELEGYPRRDILELFEGEVKKAFRYVELKFIENVEKFFADEEYIGLYLESINSRAEEYCFPDEMYYHIARNLGNKYMEWSIRQEPYSMVGTAIAG
jgi:hypothetical protein